MPVRLVKSQDYLDLNDICDDFIIPVCRHKQAKWEQALANTQGITGKMQDLELIIDTVLYDNSVKEADTLMSLALAKAAWQQMRRTLLKGIANWYKERLEIVRKGKELVDSVTNSTDISDAEYTELNEDRPVDAVDEMDEQFNRMVDDGGYAAIELTAEQAIAKAEREES